MHHIQNDTLQITIDSKGAELKSLYHVKNEMEYMWSGDPVYWAKTSPVLFPIVGTLKDNTYFYNDKPFHLSRHGFARDKNFTVTNHKEDEIIFTLESSEETLSVYPFAFRFSIGYTLQDNVLAVQYSIENTGNEDMFFSVGGHPAFTVPLTNETTYEDYELEFEKEETTYRWPISKDGLIEKEPQPLLHNSCVLPLSKNLFSKDALVLKHLHSKSVTLKSGKVEHGIRFSFVGFPYLGLWAASGADFLCIEPWQGIADSVDTNQQLKDKEGIVQLPKKDLFKLQWEVECF